MLQHYGQDKWAPLYSAVEKPLQTALHQQSQFLGIAALIGAAILQLVLQDIACRRQQAAVFSGPADTAGQQLRTVNNFAGGGIDAQQHHDQAVVGQVPAIPQFHRTHITDAQTMLTHSDLDSEVFGPASLIVRVRDMDELLAVAEHLEGQLTATLQIDEDDHTQARRLLPVLERKVGRILANGFPTGVEVSHAMVHGGPFPSTSNAMFTSVGACAIDRFLRPVCYQDLPDALLPEALQHHNPLGLWRMTDGVPSRN